MYIDKNFEVLIDHYNIKKLPSYARANVREHAKSGALGLWILSLIGFVLYFIGILLKNWFALPLVATGTPLIIVWGIYTARTPSYSGQKRQIK